MTREKQFAKAKAIAVLECMAVDITSALAEMAEENPMAEVLKQRIEAIDTAQSALGEQSRWISVEDRLPDPCTPVLFFRKNKYNAKCVEIGFYVGDGRWSKGGWYSKSPTHWMPLPDPPEVIGANG